MSETAAASRSAWVHPTAEVEPGAELAEDVRVWHLCHVRTGARVGDGTSLGRGVFVDAGVQIGARCKVQNGVSVYRGVHLEDEVFLGPGAVLTNDLRPRATSADWAVTPTRVRRGASIGAGAVVVCGTTIGVHAMVGAGAVVTRDVPDHALVIGNPARTAGWVCRCGDIVSRAATRPDDLRCAACAL